MSVKEAVLEFIEDNQILRRTFIWGGLALVIGFFVFGPYRLTSVNGATMGPELRGTEYYGAIVPEKICRGEYVRINHPQKPVKLVRVVAGFAGEKFTITDAGYSLDDKPYSMSETWIKRASARLLETSLQTIPEGKVLLMRTEPDRAKDDDYETFLVANLTEVDRLLERVLISFEPMRVGRSLRKNGKDCTALQP